MLIPVERELAIYPGAQFDPLFVFYTDPARTQPVNLTGYSAQLTIGNGLLTLTSPGGLTLGGAAGTIQAAATGAQTAGLSLGSHPWFLQWTPSGGQPDIPAFGIALVAMPAPVR